ncbi:helix-turn-helix domain-containing protein [Serratia fonticola]|uniref:winged helix-turn-helix transcriptional regulator n=1 Tax=Serratia fonticola TaxID=47917 RepID=UPI003AAE28CD
MATHGTSFNSITYESVPKKPYNHILKLIDCFSTNQDIIETKNKQIFNYTIEGQKMILILHKGSIALYRKHDNMILSSESGPFIFGMSQQLSLPDYLFLRCQEDCLVSPFPLDEAFKLIAQHDLWESLAKMLIYSVSRVQDHCAKISVPSAYEIIRFQLIELMSESPEFRQSTTTANYITSRTFLSRSGTMRILSELRAGNYITMEKGILIDVHHLPLRY